MRVGRHSPSLRAQLFLVPDPPAVRETQALGQLSSAPEELAANVLSSGESAVRLGCLTAGPACLGF